MFILYDYDLNAIMQLPQKIDSLIQLHKPGNISLTGLRKTYTHQTSTSLTTHTHTFKKLFQKYNINI